MTVNKATQSGNAQIHGMTQVTPASITYITTQVLMNSIVFIAFVDTGMFKVHFVLSSPAVFSRTDTTTNSKHFYNSVLEYFGDVDEQDEVHELLTWWNQCGA
jgi:hypothetical protein